MLYPEQQLYEYQKEKRPKLDHLLDELFKKDPIGLCLYLKVKAKELWNEHWKRRIS